MLMILPRPRGIMRLAASRPITNALVRLASMTLRHSSVCRSTIGLRSWIPALLTRMSMAMPAESSARNASAMAASSVTSKHEAWRTSWPAAFISSAAAFRRPGSEPLSTTAAPAAARPSAMARPSPRDDPVTSAVRPARENRLSDIRASSRLRPAHGQIGAVEHGRKEFDAQARPFHRIDVPVLDGRNGGDEFPVPPRVEGPHGFLDQRVGLAEGGMDGSREADGPDAVMGCEGPV